MTDNEGKAGAPKMPRKRFLDWLLGTSLGGLVAAVLYPVTRYIVPPEVAESAVSNVVLPFKPTDVAPNSGRIFKFGNKPGILVKTPGGDLRAFSAICTHLECTVQYRDDLKEIWCACHNGHYDLQGRNVSGPPPRPLTPYNVNVRGDQIVVSQAT
ncbi:MAG: Rieske 2Fe-2S domain-containing protein [Gemmatimonadota bacterium]|jgi:Rieske Fe-S protein